MTEPPKEDPIGDGRKYVEMAALAKYRDEHAAIERAVEASIQGGEHGVLIVRSSLDGRLLHAEPNELVPYGRAHETRLRR